MQVAGHPRHAGHAAPRLQVLRQDPAHRLLPPGARPEPGAGGALSGQSAGAHPATAFQPEVGTVAGRGAVGQRHPGGDAGTQEPAQRPDRRQCHPPVPPRPRPARADLRVHQAHPGALRGGYRRGAHDHAPGGVGHPLPALQPGHGRRRGQPAGQRGPQLQDRLPVGRGPATRQPARSACPLSASRRAGEGRRRWQEGPQGEPDLSPLSPVAGGAPDGGGRRQRRGGAQLSGRALGRQRQEQHHRLAGASAVQPAQRAGRAPVRQRGGHHRPGGAGPPVAEHHLPVRSPPGRGAEDRRGLAPTGRGAGSRRADHHHHAAEVSRSSPGSWRS